MRAARARMLDALLSNRFAPKSTYVCSRRATAPGALRAEAATPGIRLNIARVGPAAAPK